MEINTFLGAINILEKILATKKGICPNAERLNDREYLGFEMCKSNLSKEELSTFIKAFYKVWKNLNELKKYKKKFI